MGLHFPGDIIGGAMVGSIVGFAVYTIMRKLPCYETFLPKMSFFTMLLL